MCVCGCVCLYDCMESCVSDLTTDGTTSVVVFSLLVTSVKSLMSVLLDVLSVYKYI